jgi:Carboxypeptidase regulatory-like domain
MELSAHLINVLSTRIERRPNVATALVAMMFIAFSASGLYAQGYGTISGTVTDPSGAAVVSATVKATQTQTGRETVVTSGTNGDFVFPTLPPSVYSLTVSATGFQTYTQTDIVLQADQKLTASVRLRIGLTSETITVTAELPQVDATSGTLSQVIDERRVVDLPLNGRNAGTLIMLVAGVGDAANQGNGVNQGNGKTFPAAVVTSVNGTLPNQSNYLLNGGNNVDEMTNVNAPFPFPDAVQEFSVQTSNYDAAYGQSAGGVVNIITKSGTTSFHGDAFEFLRNGYFNARPFFALTPDNIHRHQFGGTIGGPVLIPRISKGQSTQFFFGYQNTMIHQASNASTVTVPTLAEEGRAGQPYADFGNLCTAGWDASNVCNNAAQRITNPFTNVPYALNRIPSTDFDPAAVAYEKAFPTFSGTEAPGKIGGPVSYTQPTVQNFYEYIARVDHQFGASDHLFGHYFQDFFNQPAVYDPNMLASYRSYFSTRYHSALLAETHIFTPRLVNNLVLNWQRIVALRGGPPDSQNITGYGVQNLWQPNNGPYLAARVNGYFGASSSAFAGWYRGNYTFNDDLHWVKGNHNLAFGGHIEMSSYDVTNVYQSYGDFSFNSATNKIGNITYQYPNAMANFQMGFLTGFGQGNFELVNDRNHFPGLYAQDSWKVNRRLQLNFGVRWEEFAPWHNRVGQLQEFFPEAYASNKTSTKFTTLPAGMMLSGDPGVAYDGAKNKYFQFMPRFGIAYDVMRDGKTVVRGGAGIFYQNRLPGFFNLNQFGLVPNTIAVNLSNLGMYTSSGASPGGPFSNPYCVGGCGNKGTPYTNPFPFTLPFPSNKVFPNQILLVEYDPSGDFKVPVTYAFNATLERQITASWAMRLAYVGSRSRHQFVNLELNPSVNNGSGLSANARRPYNTAPVVGPCTTSTGCAMSYSQIVVASMTGSANYNSLQATLDKKFSNGLSLLANLTWSKSFDNMPQATRVSNTEDLNAGESYVYPQYPQNATGIPAAAYVADIGALDRGLSDIDHPILISISYVYELPKLHNGNSILKYIVNGWSTSGLIMHRSGDSLTAYMGQDISLTGLGQDRAVQDFSKPAYSKDAGGAGYCPLTKSCVNWFNNAAFSVPVNTGVGTGFGNVVKGSLRGPAQTVWNAALVRSFRLAGERSLQFRAEYFNVLNHPQFNNPNVLNPVSSSTTFGTITGTADPRIAQFALKFLF